MDIREEAMKLREKRDEEGEATEGGGVVALQPTQAAGEH